MSEKLQKRVNKILGELMNNNEQHIGDLIVDLHEENKALKIECLKWEEIAESWHRKYYASCEEQFDFVEQKITGAK